MAGGPTLTRRALLTGARQRAGHASGLVIVISSACLAHTGVTCMTCRDECPEEAVRFRPRIGAPFAPEVDHDRCTRCGACVGPCPAGAIALMAPPSEAPDA